MSAITGSSAVTVADTGARSIADTSPRSAPGPRSARTTSLPLAVLEATLTRPARSTTNEVVLVRACRSAMPRRSPSNWYDTFRGPAEGGNGNSGPLRGTASVGIRARICSSVISAMVTPYAALAIRRDPTAAPIRTSATDSHTTPAAPTTKPPT